MRTELTLGIDAGGTYTNAILLDRSSGSRYPFNHRDAERFTGH